jgi:electron transfer flavoprotein alpha subunit
VVKNGGYDKVIASTSAFGKDVVPRLGGLLDSQPITDVIQILVLKELNYYNRMVELSS